MPSILPILGELIDQSSIYSLVGLRNSGTQPLRGYKSCVSVRLLRALFLRRKTRAKRAVASEEMQEKVNEGRKRWALVSRLRKRASEENVEKGKAEERLARLTRASEEKGV